MSDSYQLRKDIDSLKQRAEELSSNQELIVRFDEESKLYNENATIDNILENYYDIEEVNELIGSGGGGTVAWNDITGKPETFTPSPHTHTVSDITDIDEYTELEIKKGYRLLKDKIRTYGGL